ncbi:MAG: AIR synthase related protein, partial [Candidatus Helarchaeales archaeon]
VAGDPEYCNIFHADGAGTKTSVAYIYYKETGDASVFRGIAQDSIVMNLDDVMCVGACGNFLLTNIIDRNKHVIPGEVIAEVIKGHEDFCETLRKLNINIYTTGGETADVGDLVKTMTCNSTIFTRMKRKNVITGENIKPDHVIVGLSSTGQASYEKEPNSGIGSNGLTMARHELLSKYHAEKYPESYDSTHLTNLAYTGPYRITDEIPDLGMTVGKAILSPTRTYAPILLKIFSRFRNEIAAIIHNTGGGQTKCLRFGKNIHYVKDNLFPTPPLFEIIQKVSNATWREMYQVFNMGHRLELICEEAIANDIIKIAKNFKVEAKIIGHCEKTDAINKLTIISENGEFTYPK